ncbi:MAG: adenylate/guanylate cyclase domain-containing protein, partial [Thermoflexales bacterium]
MFGNSATAKRSATSSADGERKRVTVLFTDIVGSTSLAEKLDPEEWGEIVSGAHAVVAEAIQKYDGRIAQLLGDGALAFFGAPTQHEDDPERAVYAGLEILRGVAEYARQLKTAGRVPEFRMRVGLNTGLVVVGNIGAGQHVEYLAVGDTVNLAARMQSAAEPDTICIAENTAREVRHAFELQSLGALELKGKSEPVPAYRVLRAKTTIESKRGIVGLDSPIVGREREIAQLRERIDGLMRGRGGIVSLIGEAGLGKSRLASEIVLRASEDFDRLEGRSLSFEMTRPFAPFIEIFNRLLDIRPGEPPAQAYAKIRDPYLATLMGVKPTGEDLSRVRFLDPPLLRERIMAAAIDTLARRAAKKPLVVLLEDLHWADSASLDLVERLMAVTGEEALLLALVFRPGANEPSWPLHLAAQRDYSDRYTPIVLEPLTEGQARSLVANLLEIEDLPESVRALILARAEGNPFFAEEIIRSLLDSGLVIREGDHWRATREIASIALPDTLAGVISARLDRLDEGSKRAAQTASVIGREFHSDVLKEISDIGEPIGPALDKLEERELVHLKPALPGAYLFKHALTQDAA